MQHLRKIGRLKQHAPDLDVEGVSPDRRGAGFNQRFFTSLLSL
jgi:hypothetical protein